MAAAAQHTITRAAALCREIAQVQQHLFPLPPPPPLPLPPTQQQQGSICVSQLQHDTYSYLVPPTLLARSADSLSWQCSGGSDTSVTTVAAAAASVPAVPAAASAAWLPDQWLQPAVGLLGRMF